MVPWSLSGTAPCSLSWLPAIVIFFQQNPEAFFYVWGWEERTQVSAGQDGHWNYWETQDWGGLKVGNNGDKHQVGSRWAGIKEG